MLTDDTYQREDEALQRRTSALARHALTTLELEKARDFWRRLAWLLLFALTLAGAATILGG